MPLLVSLELWPGRGRKQQEGERLKHFEGNGVSSRDYDPTQNTAHTEVMRGTTVGGHSVAAGKIRKSFPGGRNP